MVLPQLCCPFDQIVRRLRPYASASFAWLVCVVFLSRVLLAADGPKVQRALPVGCQVGKSIEVTLVGTFATWPVQTWIDTQGIQIQASEISGKLTVTVSESVPPGLYHYRVFDANGASPLLPLVVDQCGNLLEVEPNDHHRQGQRVDALPTAVHGCLEKYGDVDTFQVTLKQGQTLVAAVDGQRIGSPMDADLQLLSPSGIILTQQFDHRGLDPELKFTATADGDYQIRVLAFPEKPDSSIGYAGGPTFVYRLLLTCGPYVQFTDPAALTTKQGSSVELIGVNLVPNTRISLPPFPTTEQKARHVSFPGMLGIITLPVTAGELFIDTEPNDLSKADAKASAGQNENIDNLTLPQSISIPSIVTGKVAHPGDQDTFSFPVKKDQRWKFRIEAQVFGSPLDAVLTITDAQGKQLATDDDVGDIRDPALSWVAPNDGEYHVTVRDLHRHGSQSHWYRLTIEPESPDFRLSTTTDIFVGKVNQAVEIPVTVQRTLDLASEVTIGLETELAGSRFEVTSKKDDDSAKSVKLLINSSEAFSGPIRIVGRADNLPSQYARPSQHPSDWLWLTLTP